MEIKEGARFSTGLEEFDRVLGGGAFCGSIVLIGGEPGIGKSTLMLQSAMNMARQGLPVLYATGEESLQQVAHRAARVGEPPSNLMLLPTTDLEAVQRETQRGSYRVLVTDSIQTPHREPFQCSGSVSQVRQCAAELSAWPSHRPYRFHNRPCDQRGVTGGPQGP